MAALVLATLIELHYGIIDLGNVCGVEAARAALGCIVHQIEARPSDCRLKSVYCTCS